MKFIFKLIVLLVLVVIAAGAWVWSGQYDIGADSPHWQLTRQAIDTLRERSIETRAEKIRVPDLDDPALLSEGAEHYAEMCTGCHLAPGMDESELRKGLYPRPPNLTRFAPAPAEAFWVIKHGIKMSGMPAWGKTHNDQKIWAMVAYLQKQPTLTAARFRQLAGQMDEPAMAEHDHESEQHDHAPGMEAGHAVGEPAMAGSIPAAPQSGP